jgi:tight adherence protein B
VVTDLVAAVLLTGMPPTLAVEVVGDILSTAGDPAADGLRAVGAAVRGAVQSEVTTPDDAVPAGLQPLADALSLAARTGLGPVPLVHAAAAEARRRRAARSQVAARRLGTLVVLPTGLCLLPAFVLLTVAPLVIDLLLG